jgi:glycosyltransferase involved in cell wall biosynthesis
MKSIPLISLICPVYKAEAYIRRSIDSVLSQTFENWELILIDDGSPDNSGRICDEYATKDKRIRVFHNLNKGVSATRQFGLDHARGEYIIHIDPDDWIEKEMLSELYSTAKNNDAEMVLCDYYKDSKEGTYYISQEPFNCTSEIILSELFKDLHGSTWNKLIKTSSIRKYKISFPKTFNFCEDLFFNSQLLLNIRKIVYLPKAYYHYNIFENTNSIVTKYSAAIQQEDLCMYKNFCTLLEKSSCELSCKIRIADTIIARAFYGNINSSYDFSKTYFRFAWYMIRNKKESPRMRFLFLLSCLGFYKISYFLYKQKRKISNSIINTPQKKIKG